MLGDKFLMEKEYLMEIEELSESKCNDSWVFAKAKSLIIETMLKKSQ